MLWKFSFIVFGLFVASSAYAASGFVDQNLWLSNSSPLEGDVVSIHALLVNSEDRLLQGEVVFFDEPTGQPIGLPQVFILQKSESRIMRLDWQATAGTHAFQARIQNAFFVDGAKKISASQLVSSDISTQLFVDEDSDKDGLGTMEEKKKGSDPMKSDSDEDGLKDDEDPNPINPDSDGDGDRDGTDPAPQNSAVFTPPDTDGDGIVDVQDSDKDNDGLYNFQEEQIGSNPLLFDTDRDGVSDKTDVAPADPSRSFSEDTSVLPTEVNEAEQTESNPILNEVLDSVVTEENGQVLGAKETRPATQEQSERTRKKIVLTVGIISSVILLLSLLLHLFVLLKKRKRKIKKSSV